MKAKQTAAASEKQETAQESNSNQRGTSSHLHFAVYQLRSFNAGP